MAVGRDLKGGKNHMVAVSLPTATLDGPVPPVVALSSALNMLESNRSLRELREVTKGVTKQIGGPMHELAAKVKIVGFSRKDRKTLKNFGLSLRDFYKCGVVQSCAESNLFWVWNRRCYNLNLFFPKNASLAFDTMPERDSNMEPEAFLR
ncbi:hypothetical protein K1719_043119 [Acacia pycnantha]|nr:hypothetical protein K1719_043119 [Acacia pycnantha]